MTIALTEGRELDSRIHYAKALAASNLLPRTYQNHPENVLVAIEYGHALGIPPIQAINSIHVIEGKPSASADLIAALVRRAGHRLRVVEEPTSDGPKVTATLIRADDPDFAFTAIWDRAKARTAGLLGKGNWKNYEGQMMRARAITEVCRQGANEALYGVLYSPEELGGDTPPTEPVSVPTPVVARFAQTTSLDEALAADEPVDADIVEHVTTAQLLQLSSLMTAAGLSKADMLDEACRVAGRELPSANALTASEADTLIEYLAGVVPVDEPDLDGALIPEATR